VTKPEPVEGWHMTGFDRLSPRRKKPQKLTEAIIYATPRYQIFANDYF
jgi:hypothetical protein